MARSCRPEGPASGAGSARSDAVQWRAAAASGRPRADVADAGARQRRAGRNLDQGKLQHGEHGSVGDAQLPVNPMQVDLDGALREPETPTNLRVGNTLSEHLNALVL